MLEILRAGAREEGQEVAGWCTAIARRLGLSRSQVDGLQFGAILHDVGNVTIPLRLLTKTGPLTRTESSLVREHSRRGHDLLQNLNFPWPVERMVLEHHERMDGSGYPHRLRGSEACLEARIIAVADSLVAMCRHRPYRPARPFAQAMDEILSCRDSLYDPDVVDALDHMVRTSGGAMPTPMPERRLERLWQRAQTRARWRT